MKGWVIHAGNQGLHGFLVNVFVRTTDVPVSELYSYAQLPLFGQYALILLPAGFVLLAIIASWKHRTDYSLIFFFWSMIYLLAYKDIWEHSYTYLLLPLYLVYQSGRSSSISILPVFLMIALPTAFVFYDVPLPTGPFDPEPYWLASISVLHHSTKCIPLLLFYFYCFHQLKSGSSGMVRGL